MNTFEDVIVMDASLVVLFAAGFFLIALNFIEPIARVCSKYIKQLYEVRADLESHYINSNGPIRVGDLRDNPRDVSKVVLCLYIAPDLEDELYDLSRAGSGLFLFVVVAALLLAAVDDVIGSFSIDHISAVEAVIGGSQVVTFMYVFFIIWRYHIKLRSLLKSAV